MAKPMSLPVLEKHLGVSIVRDDLLPGGTKSRLLAPLFERYPSIAYASPAFGGAQVALAYAAKAAGGTATVFVAKRAKPHPRTLEAYKNGAVVYQVPYGYLSNIQAKARRFSADRGAYYLEFGAEDKTTLAVLGELGERLWKRYGPWDEVWSAAGSGVLTRGLQLGMPCEFHAVLVGRESNVGRATAHRYPIPFETEEKVLAPFPSCPNYDRKAWNVCVKKKRGRVLFWNVMGGYRV